MSCFAERGRIDRSEPALAPVLVSRQNCPAVQDRQEPPVPPEKILPEKKTSTRSGADQQKRREAVSKKDCRRKLSGEAMSGASKMKAEAEPEERWRLRVFFRSLCGATDPPTCSGPGATFETSAATGTRISRSNQSS